MTQTALSIFQGQDWMTHRLPVAQAYDTLDRMGDLCFPMTALEIHRNDVTLEVINLLSDLAEELNVQLDLVMADLHPSLSTNVALRWVSVELRMLATQLRALLAVPDDVRTEADRLSAIGDQLNNIKSLLRKIDL